MEEAKVLEEMKRLPAHRPKRTCAPLSQVNPKLM